MTIQPNEKKLVSTWSKEGVLPETLFQAITTVLSDMHTKSTDFIQHMRDICSDMPLSLTGAEIFTNVLHILDRYKKRDINAYRKLIAMPELRKTYLGEANEFHEMRLYETEKFLRSHCNDHEPDYKYGSNVNLSMMSVPDAIEDGPLMTIDCSKPVNESFIPMDLYSEENNQPTIPSLLEESTMTEDNKTLEQATDRVKDNVNENTPCHYVKKILGTGLVTPFSDSMVGLLTDIANFVEQCTIGDDPADLLPIIDGTLSSWKEAYESGYSDLVALQLYSVYLLNYVADESPAWADELADHIHYLITVFHCNTTLYSTKKNIHLNLFPDFSEVADDMDVALASFSIALGSANQEIAEKIVNMEPTLTLLVKPDNQPYQLHLLAIAILQALIHTYRPIKDSNNPETSNSQLQELPMTNINAKLFENKINSILSQEYNPRSVETLVRALFKEVEGRPLPKSLTPRFKLEEIIASKSWEDALKFMASKGWQIDTARYTNGPQVITEMKTLLKPYVKAKEVKETQPELMPDPPAEITIEADPSDQVNYQEAVARTHADDFKPGIGMKIVNEHGYKEVITKVATDPVDSKINPWINLIKETMCVYFKGFSDINIEMLALILYKRYHDVPSKLNFATIQLALMEAIVCGYTNVKELNRSDIINLFLMVHVGPYPLDTVDWAKSLMSRYDFTKDTYELDAYTIPVLDSKQTINEYVATFRNFISRTLNALENKDNNIERTLITIFNEHMSIHKFINHHTSSQTLGDFTMAQAPDNSVLVTQIGDLVYHDIHKAPAYEYKVHLAERAQQLVRDHLLSVPNILSLATPCFTQLATLHAIQNDTLIIADEDKDFFIRIFNNVVLIPNQYDIFKPYIDKLEQALTKVIPNYIYLASSYTLALRTIKATLIAAVDTYFNRYVVNSDLAQPLNMKHKQLVALIALMKDKYMSNTQYQPQPIHPINPGPYHDPNLFQNPAPHGTYPTQPMSQMQRPMMPGYVPMDRSRRGDAGYRRETPQMSPRFPGTDVLGVSAMNPFGMGSGGRRMDMFSGSLQTTAMQYAADRTVNQGVAMIQLLEEVAELNKQIDEKTRERERLLHDVKQLAKDLVFLNKE